MQTTGTHFRRACLLLSLVAASIGPTVATDLPLGRLRGEIKQAGGRGIPGVTVVSARSEAPALLLLTSTDPDGFLAMDGVSPGEYRVSAWREDYRLNEVDGVAITGPYRFVVDLILVPGRFEWQPIRLPSGAGSDPAFSLQVEDARGRPMEGVLVRLEARGMRSDPFEARSDEKGEVRFEAMVEGTWRLIISRAGWTRIVIPELSWGGGEISVRARLLPAPEGLPLALDEMLPRAEPLASEWRGSLDDAEPGDPSFL